MNRAFAEELRRRPKRRHEPGRLNFRHSRPVIDSKHFNNTAFDQVVSVPGSEELQLYVARRILT